MIRCVYLYSRPNEETRKPQVSLVNLWFPKSSSLQDFICRVTRAERHLTETGNQTGLDSYQTEMLTVQTHSVATGKSSF